MLTMGPETYLEALEDILGRQKLTVAHVGGKDTDNLDPRKILQLILFLMFYFFLFIII